MKFSDALAEQGKFTTTENGAVALNTTSNHCLDLFSTIGALRQADDVKVARLFSDAYEEDPLTATKILFYARDVRGGLGERKTFRTILRWAADHTPEAVRPNLDLIGVFGRYDDLYCLIGTKLEDEMWAVMGAQLREDLDNLNKGNAVSLLGKWIKSPNTHVKETRRLGELTAAKLGYPLYNFKRIVRSLRRQIDIVETHMSKGEWDQIQYGKVPSRAMYIYHNAFMRHDAARYCEYLDSVEEGEDKINSSTLYPYDIVEKYISISESLSSLYLWSHAFCVTAEDKALELQWAALPDYVPRGCNAIVMADTSGSMFGRPLATAVSLAIYFAERNTGEYHNLFMSFSRVPEIMTIKGSTLQQKVQSVLSANWNENTNLKAAFMKVLQIAEEGHVPPEEMPKAIVVISDMEIDECGDMKWSFYDNMKSEFEEHGYEIPNIIFWNVSSRHDVFHVDATRKGVQLVSGSSASTFKHVMENIDMTPVEAMMKVVNSERYSCIQVA